MYSGPQTKEPWSDRPYFTPRQLLSARHLNHGFDDEMKRERLLNRALHGQGVVFGFGLHLDAAGGLLVRDGCVEITNGLALDRHGRILYWCGGSISVSDLAGPPPHDEGRYTLKVHYAERPAGHDGCWPIPHDDAHLTYYGVVFTLDACHDPVDRDCPPQVEGARIDLGDYLGQRTGGILDRPGVPMSDDLADMHARPGLLCPTDGGRWVFDPDAGLALAEVTICDLTRARSTGGPEGAEPDCDPEYGFCPEPPEIATIRPYAYRAPLLYELGNCCDVELARVERTSWQSWTDGPGGWNTEVPWPEFARRIQSRTDGFTIHFTKPVQTSTLHPASVFLTAIFEEERTDYWMTQRVPLLELQPLELVHRNGKRLARGVRLVPDPDWLHAEVNGRRSTLFQGSQFELTIRGQLVRDEFGRMLDARPIDVDCGRRCQARPGDDFLSVFQVGPWRGYGRAEGAVADEATEGAERAEGADPDAGDQA